MLGLHRISPASAADSMSVTAVAAGPTTSSSRWVTPAATSKISPVCTPIEMRSRTFPLPVVTGPRSFSRLRIIAAARTARPAWPSPENINSRASPPNESRSPPSDSAWPSRSVKTSVRIAVSSSAPALPSSESRSESAVKPLISAKTRVPSIVVCSPGPGAHCVRMRGTKGTNSDKVVTLGGFSVAISTILRHLVFAITRKVTEDPGCSQARRLVVKVT